MTKSDSDRITKLEITVEEVIRPTLKKMDEFIDENRSGIRTASLLDNKIVTAFLVAIVAGAFYIASKGGHL